MRKVGNFLFQARTKQDKDLSELAQQLRVREEYLQAIENNRFQTVPGGAAIIAGIIKKYAQALDLDQEKMTAIFRRDFVSEENNEIVLQGLAKHKNLLWTPKIISFLAAVALLVLGGLFYFSRSFWLNRPPGVEITQPQEGENFQQKEITVKGRVKRADTVVINSTPVLTESDNTFEKTVACRSGENVLQVKAVNSQGEEIEKIRHFFCQ